MLFRSLDEIRRVVREWSKTEEGKQAYLDSMKDFNWGDFADYFDCKKLQLGIENPVKLNPSIISAISWETLVDDFRVEHDELLMREDDSFI